MELKEPDRPSRIGRYEIREELGRGMMGVVYEAHDPVLGRTIALKTIRLAFAATTQEREDYERRFQAEARIAARLSHRGIVVVHDVGRDAEHDILYIALECLHGRTLAELAEGAGRLDWREALRIAGRVAEALQYAHGQGVIHRDIKPANIMVLASGEPKIMDFGIAKLEAAQLTSTGQSFGTPLYMSPEQALGEPVDARTDLFSLGSVLYAAIAGRPPFDAPNVPSIMARVAYKQPKPLSQLVPGVPAEVDYLVARAMAKSPADRHPDGGALAEDIEDILAGRPPRHRAGWTAPDRGEGTRVSRRGALAPELELILDEQPRTRPRRRPALGLVALLALAAAGYFYLRPADRSFWREAAAETSRSPTVQRLIGRLVRLAASWSEPAAQAERPAGSTAAAVPDPARPTFPLPGANVTAADGLAGEPAAQPATTTLSTAGLAAADPPSATELTTADTPAGAGENGEAGDGSEAHAQADPRDGVPHPAHPTLPAPDSPAPGNPAPAAPGTLAIDFDHHFRRGNLQVWVDGRRVLDEDFNGRMTSKILALELHKGVVQEILSLSPGRHDVRVQVRWDDNVRTGRISGTFRPGVTRRLDVEVGRIRRNLRLSWR